VLQATPIASVRLWQILLKKSFLAKERNFSGPLMRSARVDVTDHIVFHKMTTDLRIDPSEHCSGRNV
jgi:hypothetical protein